MLRTIASFVVCLMIAGSVWAAGGDEIKVPTPKPGQTPSLSGEARYNEGLACAEKHDWARAEQAYREAIDLKPNLAEAWNGLGHALKMQGKFEDAFIAYDEALRLRPDFPLALEYLGEAYVLVGRMDDARSLLDRLQPLDTKLADQLASAIRAGAHSW
jgi:Flp pilus assembly protein TadD